MPDRDSSTYAAPGMGSRAKQRITLLVLIAAQFVVMLDTAVVNVALPSIQGDLGLTQTGVAWVVNAYFLSFGGFLLLSGRAADLFGSRRMFMLGSALFTATTLMAGLAPNEAILVIARALQGISAAILSPAGLSIVLVGFQGAERAKAMGAWGAASAAGGAIGVSAGGLVTAALGWQWVFFLTVPITLLTFVVAPLLFDAPSAMRTDRRFDAWGAASITGGALSLIYATLSVAERGWLSTETIGGGMVGVALLGAFIAIERRAADPIVPLQLFRERTVSAGVIVGLLGGAARVSTFYLSALYLQQALAFSPGVAGFAMVPTSVAGFLVSLLLLPRIVKRLGAGQTLVLGLVLLACGHFWLAHTHPGAGYWFDVLPGLLLAAAGVALSFTPSTMVIAAGIPATLTGLASGLANASSQIGGAFGIAAFSAIAAITTQAGGLATGFHYAFIAAGVIASVAAIVAFEYLRPGSGATHPRVRGIRTARSITKGKEPNE
ncbi:EmrB/QacA subfamily drug resistance transporter [Pseudarthrobacter sp. W1I19]|uniref:MFS transporter n=1 Tax=Pseudarthrobacter sp. W1I19 TaxID=3042288 RepID=UPI002787905A|nr:MFS transporter [Pseudarthrobacter sp. W1I19]MDQ0923427.1 EmrB/QacA subfamily drug resistance transporter [Pseudarthrobacter sp. W1I19]